MGVSLRVARPCKLVAQDRPVALVARVARVSRQAMYKRPSRPPSGQRRPWTRSTGRPSTLLGRTRQTEPHVAALTARHTGMVANRKRVQRLMPDFPRERG